MRSQESRRAYKSSNVPVYCFDTDSMLERVIRDPMSVLLGRCSLALENEPASTDPYNRVGGSVARSVRK